MNRRPIVEEDEDSLAKLLGDMSEGKCQDCGWNNNSAVAKACGCVGFKNYDLEEHNRLIAMARVAQSEWGHADN